MDLKREGWNETDYNDFLDYLDSLSDTKYREFNSRIIPDTSMMFGIKIPVLRKIAKEISKGNADAFLKLEKGKYHEEIIIEGLVAAEKKSSYDEMLKDMIYFSEKIYNWAICDTVVFKGSKKYMPQFWRDKDIFLKSKNPWQIRFGLGILMKFYLIDEYIDDVLEICVKTESDFYYVNMMRAWVIATAAAEYYDKVLELLNGGRLDNTVFKMTVRKMLDSYKISKEGKDKVREIQFFRK